MDEQHSALIQLRAYLSQGDKRPNDRLPPERELAQLIGVTRGDLRKALAILEQEGLVWRHVGKGTFVGDRSPLKAFEPASLLQQCSPSDVMRARMTLEPALAAQAALQATPRNIDDMFDVAKRSREAATWREYEACDNQFHKLIADSTQNLIMSSMFDMLSAVRRAMVWGRRRSSSPHPPANHHSFDEHERIIQAIADRDPGAASAMMLEHLLSVERKLLTSHSPLGLAHLGEKPLDQREPS
ncbi:MULTISPECIES: FadR/GntR family transcriptional regulator [Halomonas]|mgnify:CR=1 FL=1|uniref:FadR/GntR family transcriptional regulator n=1 Tax=Halomonas TaxID=2745 RepID=UPI000E5A897A|nr:MULTISPECIES: FCD domain-containing protein [Halomonas]AXY43779.1 FadR family transcriptional regulator [Halomonas sp. JS92-SW72]